MSDWDQRMPTAVSGTASEMPTIWEDPAGKGYPCFERPMTAVEARSTVESYGQQIACLTNALASLLQHFNDEGLHLARIDLPLGTQKRSVEEAKAALRAFT